MKYHHCCTNPSFYGASSFDSRIGNWIVSIGTSFANSLLTIDNYFICLIKLWNLTIIVNTVQPFNLHQSSMFFLASSFNSDISNWDVSSGTDFVSSILTI